MTRVVIADGLPVFRAAVRRVLERELDFVVDEASTFDELETALAKGVDVALVDEQLPPAGAGAAIAAAREACSDVIVWALRSQPASILAAVAAGATGYLRKDIAPATLVRYLRGLAVGEAAFSRDLVALMVREMHESEGQRRRRTQLAKLSAREREVLQMVAEGSRNREIAVELTISEFTVKRHVQNILDKLAVATRHDAAGVYATSVAPSLA